MRTPTPDGRSLAVAEPAAASLRANGDDGARAALRAAARAVASTVLADSVDPGRASVVREELDALVAELAAGAPRDTGDERRRTLRRRLLAPLRAQVVREWSAAEPPPSVAEVLPVLRALELLREQVEQDWGGLGEGVDAPEGMEVILELAHDLRSPLTSILFLSETMRRGQSGEVNDLQRRQLGLVYSAALGMVGMASDLVELMRSRLVESAPSPFSVTEVFESVRDIVRPLAEEKKISLRMLAPQGDQRVGHAAALSRVLLNLVTNGLKYTSDGFVEITARALDLRTVEFSVRDSGPGLRHEARSTLFEPFRRRGDGDRWGFSGTGLGLAITRRLVRAMGSELHYETAPDWGTRFFFELDLPPAGP